MKPRNRRLAFLLAGLSALGLASWLVLGALSDNLVFFFSPTQVLAREAPQAGVFRMGGMVEVGSVQRGADGLELRFVVTDTAQRVPVRYSGLVPDLFREGKGVVVAGRMSAEGAFHATEVLAKHDENYMPPPAAEALRAAGAAPTPVREPAP
jgi:cytochrome c-type biogenesis protein CcmE